MGPAVSTQIPSSRACAQPHVTGSWLLTAHSCLCPSQGHALGHRELPHSRLPPTPIPVPASDVLRWRHKRLSCGLHWGPRCWTRPGPEPLTGSAEGSAATSSSQVSSSLYPVSPSVTVLTALHLQGDSPAHGTKLQLLTLGHSALSDLTPADPAALATHMPPPPLLKPR